MSDVFTKRNRSEVMARIRGRGNKETELALAKLLRRQGITGWRRQQTVRFLIQSSGFRVRVDFVFPKRKVAVFVDGCFWHGCPRHSSPAKWLKKSSMPVKARSFSRSRGIRMTTGGGRTGKTFWREKLAANRRRDRRVSRQLRRQGWQVVRIWEHELAEGRGRRLKAEGGRGKVAERIRQALRHTRG